MKLLFMYSFWVNDRYIVVLAKDYKTAKIKAEEKYKKLFQWNRNLKLKGDNMKLGDKYYYITDKCAVGKDIWVDAKRDRYRRLTNNIYKRFIDIRPIVERIKSQTT